MDEIWKDIEGFEGYQVSNLGRVKSLGRAVNCNGGKRTVKEKILKPFINKKGYQQVQLCKDGKVKTFSVHRLVYEAFCGEIPPGMEVNHINENKSDNRLENLNLMTRKENVNWGTGIERRAKAQLNHPKRSKPVIGFDSEGNVVVTFPSAREAERHGYYSGRISSCCKGKRPTHKGLIWKYADGDC